MAQFPSPPPPRNFLEYSLTSYLGSGSFGVVWEMEGKEGENASALKIILVDEENEEKQKRELEISPKLNQNNLVKVFSIERKGVRPDELDTLVPEGANCHLIISQLRRKESFDVFCITLDLCGKNLRKWLKKDHDVESIETNLKQQGIIKGIIEGLKYLHERDIIHRDLKPENIMISTKGYVLPVKIGDYGTCRILKDPQTSTLSSWVGSELYRAPETSSNAYGLYSDIYSLGLIMWEVFQLLPFSILKGLFDRLVNDKQKDLVNLNPCFQCLTDLIVKMVRRSVRTRHKNLDEIYLHVCNLGPEFVAANSGELQVILEVCGDGANIQLLEWVYVGEFVIKRKDVSIKGCGGKTVLTPFKSYQPVLIVLGEDFQAVNLKINGNGESKVSGIRVEAANCSLENIIVVNIPSWGVDISRQSTNTKINNVRFEAVGFPVYVLGNDCSLSNITINNCQTGIQVWNPDVKGILVQSVFITNPKISGIDFNGSCKAVQLVDIQITAGPKPEASSVLDYPFRAIGVISCSGASIELKNVSCSGFDGENECDLFIGQDSLSADVEITDCTLKKIIKDGEGQYQYQHLEVRGQIKMRRSELT